MILDDAGIAGVDPHPFTWRQLRTMATARLTAEWDQTATLVCMVASIFRDPKKTPLNPLDFHPLRRQVKEVPVLRTGQEVVDMLRSMGFGK